MPWTKKITLTHSTLARTGGFGRFWDSEHTVISAEKKGASNAFHFEFMIAAAGGGTTRLRLNIWHQDWVKILPMLAEGFPKELAEVFAESTAIAVRAALPGKD